MLNRKVGIEFEISDIETYNIAKIVYKHFKYNFLKWNNRTNIIKKSKLNYNIWNVTSDSTIKNSDGSKCMMTVFIDNKLVWARPDHKNIWKGGEIITPPSNNYKYILYNLKIIIDILILKGASIKKELDDALHIHVDASDLTFEKIKLMPKKIYNIQNYLIKFFTINGVPIPLYTEDDIYRLENTKSVEEFYKEYIKLDGEELEHKHENARCRKIINLIPWLINPLENKTIEFRAFSATKNIKYIEECIYLCLDIMDYLVYDKIIDDLEERTRYIESLYE